MPSDNYSFKRERERERERWDEIAKIVCPSDIYLYYTRDIVILFQGWTWPLTLER